MEPSDWALLKYFSIKENWGDPSKMNANFLLKLDRFRGAVGQPFDLTTPAYTTYGHSDGSYHYRGLAVDGRFVDAKTRKPLTLAEHILIALKAPFNGVGIYTWSPKGTFLHLDDRKSDERKIWVSDKQGKYENLSSDWLFAHILWKGRPV